MYNIEKYLVKEITLERMIAIASHLKSEDYEFIVDGDRKAIYLLAKY
jgi:hypothetical protein